MRKVQRLSASEHALLKERERLNYKRLHHGLGPHEEVRLDELRIRRPSRLVEENSQASPWQGERSQGAVYQPGAHGDMTVPAQAPTPVSAIASAHAPTTFKSSHSEAYVTQAPASYHPSFAFSPSASNVNAKPAAPLALLAASEDMPAPDFWQALLDHTPQTP